MVRIDTYYSNGTGFVFETNDQGVALILTNYHVIEGAWAIDVLVNDSDSYQAAVLGYDEYRDLAVLQICCGEFHALSMAGPAAIKAGTEVMAIGYPLGIEGSSTVTKGIASAYRYSDNYHSWVIQTDASINPGSSGGPLIASDGRVIGVNTFVIRGHNGMSAEGLGFAISQQSIDEVLSNMKQGAQYQFPTPTPTLTPTPTRTPTPTPIAWRTHYGNGYTIKVPGNWEKSKVLVGDDYSSPDGFAGASAAVLPGKTDLQIWVSGTMLFTRTANPTHFEVHTRDVNVRSDGTGTAFVLTTSQATQWDCRLRTAMLFRVTTSKSYYITSGFCLHSLREYADITKAIMFDHFKPR